MTILLHEATVRDMVAELRRRSGYVAIFVGNDPDCDRLGVDALLRANCVKGMEQTLCDSMVAAIANYAKVQGCEFRASDASGFRATPIADDA